MSGSHPIQCGCGRFRATLRDPGKATHAVCYCHDCQAFAHFLGPPPGMLDALGGTEILAVSPAQVTLEAGIEHLVCMSLTPRGTLRWFTNCCRTPICNTPRDPKIAHVGLIHMPLQQNDAEFLKTFGPVRLYVNRGGAHGRPPSGSALWFVWSMVRYLARLMASRLSGGWRRTPFFDATTGQPRVAPEVLTPAEHARLRRLSS